MPPFQQPALTRLITFLNYSLMIFLSATLIAACNSRTDALTGSWAAESTDAPAQSFTLSENGTFASVDAGNRTYTRWEKSDNRLIFSGESFADTFRVVASTDTLLTLEANGNEFYYVRPDRRSNSGTASIISQECFVYRTGKDSASVQVSVGADRVKGTLSYDLFEKDRNRGTINGRWRGDTLFAFYLFQSEGTESVREVVFLKKSDTLVEGFGPVEMKGDSVFFKDYRKLQFGDGLVFKKAACAGI